MAEGVAKPYEWSFLFLDIVGFKIYNDQRGFLKGNEFLKRVGQILLEEFEGYISRQANDHYVIFTKNERLSEKINKVEEKVKAYDADIRPEIKVGGYIFNNKEERTRPSVEKARYACMELRTKYFNRNLLYYDDEMHSQYRMNQYVVKLVDNAIEKGYVKTYFQPVVSSKNKKICGFEALARWIDPKYGFLSPAKFVPALEAAHLIYKLDMTMLINSCKFIQNNIKNG